MELKKRMGIITVDYHHWQLTACTGNDCKGNCLRQFLRKCQNGGEKKLFYNALQAKWENCRYSGHYFCHYFLIFSIFPLWFAVFFQRPRRCRPLAKSHIYFFLFPSPSPPGDLYWIGSDKSCSTLIGRHKLGVVQMHVPQPLPKLWCVHLLNPAMQGFTERCLTQIF